MECSLEESLEISTVINAKQQYIEWLTLESPITVDASLVSHVDTAGLQALTSLFVTAKHGGLDIQLCNPSPLLCDAIEQLNLQEQFSFKTEL